MDGFIARANVEHYVGLLNNRDLATETRATVVKLLITEEDKLSRGQEHLQFAESCAAKGRSMLHQLRYLRDGRDPIDRARLDQLIAKFEITQGLLDNFCHQLRTKASSPRL